MRLLNRLLVFLFVRRKAQTHARAVLDAKMLKARERKPGAVEKKTPSSSGPVPAPADQAAPGTAKKSGQLEKNAAGSPDQAPAPAVPSAAVPAPSAREELIRNALAARKSREAEWDALPPAVKSRAIVGLGESMAAVVETFRKAETR